MVANNLSITAENVIAEHGMTRKTIQYASNVIVFRSILSASTGIFIFNLLIVTYSFAMKS